MKPHRMLIFLPRFRWFVWGLGCGMTMLCLMEGFFSIGVPVMFLLGFMTYPGEFANRRVDDGNKRLATLDAQLAALKDAPRPAAEQEPAK